MSDIIRRIERKTGVKDLAVLLGDELDPSDLQSLMLEVYRHQAKRRTPKALLDDYRTSKFSRPKPAPAGLVDWDKIAFSNLPTGFEGMELSPLCPFGTVSTLAPISQDWVVSTVRNSEVVADPTNVLALECAVRRERLAKDEETRNTTVSLATSQRVVRSQRYDNPALQAHFQLFSMCSAGRDTGNLTFETHAVSEHVRFYLKSLRLYLGDSTPLRVAIFDLAPPDPYRSDIFSTMVDELRRTTGYLTVELSNNPEKAKGYYGEIRFHMYGTNRRGDEVELADGGDTDWTRKLLGNMKERLVISGLGTERLEQFSL